MIQDPVLSDFLRRLPKTDLHIHLLGAIRPTTLVALAHKHGLALPEAGAREVYEYRDFPGFLEVLRLASLCLVDREDFSRVAYELLEDAWRKGNCRHLELSFNPTVFFDNQVRYPTVVDGLIDGMAAARRDFAISSLLIPCIDRERPAEVARAMVEEVLLHRRDAVAGIGMDFAEGKGPPLRFVEAYRLAARHGLRRTAHVCEDNQPLALAPPAHLRICIEDLACDRVDHGYNLLADPQAVIAAREQGIAFDVTVCTAKKSNLGNRMDAIKLMHDAGLRLNIGTDDPYLHHTDLEHSWAKLFHHCGWGIHQARELALAGVDACWLDEGDKRALRETFSREIDRLMLQAWPLIKPPYIDEQAA